MDKKFIEHCLFVFGGKFDTEMLLEQNELA